MGSLLLGKAKGRSIRAMGEVAHRLLAKDENSVDGAVLRRYEQNCRLVAKLHSRSIDAVSCDECKSILAVLTTEQVEVPDAVVAKSSRSAPRYAFAMATSTSSWSVWTLGERRSPCLRCGRP